MYFQFMSHFKGKRLQPSPEPLGNCHKQTTQDGCSCFQGGVRVQYFPGACVSTYICIIEPAVFPFKTLVSNFYPSLKPNSGSKFRLPFTSTIIQLHLASLPCVNTAQPPTKYYPLLNTRFFLQEMKINHRA